MSESDRRKIETAARVLAAIGQSKSKWSDEAWAAYSGLVAVLTLPAKPE